MKIALIASNYAPLVPETKKGTEIFVYDFIRLLSLQLAHTNSELTVFCSDDSKLRVPIETVDSGASMFAADLPHGKHIIFELALIGKAFQMEDRFDLYHAHIGNGDIVLPFVPMVQ